MTWWKRKQPEPSRPEESKIDDEALSFVVLQELGRLLRGYNEINVTGSHEEDLAIEQREINRLRGWAMVGLENKQIRRHYLSWLNHYQRGLDAATKELKDQRNKKQMEAYRKENAELFSRVHELKASGTIPVPPSKMEQS